MQMLFLLFKKEITKTFKLNYLKRGNVSQRNKIMASYIAVGVAFVFFLVRWIKLIFEFRSYNWMEEEIVPFLLTPVISVSVFLALIVGFFGGSGLIFFDKNYEAEYSWPVAVEITVVSKMLVPYFVLVLVDIALIGPLITLYGAVRAISIFFVLAAAVELLLLPVVPYLLGIVLGRLVLSLLQKKSSVTIRLGSIILVMMLGAYFFNIYVSFGKGYQESRASFDRVQTIMAIEEEPKGEARPLKIDYILADLTFQYNNDSFVLKNEKIQVKKGEAFGIFVTVKPNRA